MVIIKATKLLAIFGPRIQAATLGCFLLYRYESDLSFDLITHEEIHWEQSKEMGVLPFHILYLLLAIFYTYEKNPFEREAYRNEGNREYLKNRKPYSWIKYI